jgi:2-oxoglutarate dehydrogenase E1 component
MDFLHNVSPEWLERHYQLWREAPEEVDAQWQAFFAGYELGGTAPTALPTADSLKQSGVQSLIYRYRDIGHLLACTDPLSPCRVDHPLLTLDAFGLDEGDLNRVFHTRRFYQKSATLAEILKVMQETYCRAIGVEFMYIQEPAERQWLIDRMEPVRNRPSLTVDEKLIILGKLMEGTLFEEFLQRRFPAQKRFSLEGGEALMPLLEEVVQWGARQGITEMVLGMPHRGRLNVLTGIFQKPFQNIFAEFQDNIQHGVVGEGDVKYHKGFSCDRTFADGSVMHLIIAANPSHLETVDGVVEGKSRSRQERLGPEGPRRLLPVLIHGDAAFSGQGVVAEVFNLSQLDGYGTGGTLHIVINNQIGFTTLPEEARSSRYATDVAKLVEAPIFHVHGEEPEAVIHACRLAIDFRLEFGRDVVIEIICYRRHGHNEGDEPYFTQPLMYQKIHDRPPAYRLYAERLMAEGIEQEVVDGLAADINRCLQESEDKEYEPLDLGFAGDWRGIERSFSFLQVKTGVAGATLRDLAGIITRLPEGFHPHPKIASLLAKRLESVESGERIDWGTAEALAFASLIREGTRVRLSGQDSRRGTFNHRHSFIYDQETGAAAVPLAKVGREPRMFRVHDSMLSEYAVLAFEYGFSSAFPEGLTIWEAQFGDFANGAQVVIDQYIAAGETKWDRVSGLVMYLPHGFEGQGAEHSSARIERYLQLCADNNLQICTPSTPAQLFHLLRRQVHQPFRKPLIVFTPKSLLRHPDSVSALSELENGFFREVIADPADPGGVTTVCLCSGKIYVELRERQAAEGRNDVALVRLEQLYPLHGELLGELLEPYRNVKRAVWAQEEPANMGAWSWLRPQLADILGREPEYIGRPAAPSPATGSHRTHKEEQEKIIQELFGLPRVP